MIVAHVDGLIRAEASVIEWSWPVYGCSTLLNVPSERYVPIPCGQTIVVVSDQGVSGIVVVQRWPVLIVRTGITYGRWHRRSRHRVGVEVAIVNIGVRRTGDTADVIPAARYNPITQ